MCFNYHLISAEPHWSFLVYFSLLFWFRLVSGFFRQLLTVRAQKRVSVQFRFPQVAQNRISTDRWSYVFVVVVFIACSAAPNCQSFFSLIFRLNFQRCCGFLFHSTAAETFRDVDSEFRGVKAGSFEKILNIWSFWLFAFLYFMSL